MQFLTHIPPAPLSKYVDKVWFYAGGLRRQGQERVLPTGQMQIVVNLQDDRLRVYRRDDPKKFDDLSGTMLSGAQSGFRMIDSIGEAPLLGIHFAPGGAHPFFMLPMGELADCEAPLDELWGVTAKDLRERLLETRNPHQRFAIVEQALMQRLRPRSAHQGAVDFAVRQLSDGSVPSGISLLPSQMGMSWTRFIQIFREHVGLTPKTFNRIQRFQQVLKQIERAQIPAWSSVAAECGYFDQAHFIHDFREFAGITPSVYLDQRTSHRNHVAI